MDNNQIMILGNIYQTWLKDASSLVSKRRKVNSNFDFIRSTKISDLMDMPLVALMSYLDKSSSELYYLSHLCSSGRNAVQSTVQKLHPQGSHHHHMKNSLETRHLMNFHLRLKENMRWKQDLTQWTSQMALKNSEEM